MTYHIEHYPFGWCVVNENGLNVTKIPNKPGAKFWDTEQAALNELTEMTNEQ